MREGKGQVLIIKLAVVGQMSPPAEGREGGCSQVIAKEGYPSLSLYLCGADQGRSSDESDND